MRSVCTNTSPAIWQETKRRGGGTTRTTQSVPHRNKHRELSLPERARHRRNGTYRSDGRQSEDRVPSQSELHHGKPSLLYAMPTPRGRLREVSRTVREVEP